MASSESIVIRERGKAHYLEPALVARPEVELAVSELVNSGVLTRDEASNGGMLLAAGNFIGDYVTSGFRLSVVPKSPNLFRAMGRRLDGLAAARSLRGIVITSKEGQTAQDPAAELPDTLDAAIAEGLPFSFRRQRVVSSRPKGRIVFRDMLRLQGAGKGKHRAVTEQSVRELDRVMRTVLSAAVERALPVLMAAPREALRVMLAAEALGLEQSSSLGEATEAAKQIETSLSDYPAAAKLVKLSLSILRQESLWRIAEKSPNRTFAFSNGERMWELAVALLIDGSLARAHFQELSVLSHPMRGSSVRLIEPAGPEIDPDVVVYDGARAAVVGDAKYSVASSADAQDVYQLYAYVERLAAPIGVLAYLSEGASWWKELGKTADGSVLIALGIGEEELFGVGPGPAFEAFISAVAEAQAH